MALFISATKKGSLTSARGNVEFNQLKCDRSVDEQQRSFNITLTDEKEKVFSITIYGEDVLELHRVINHYVESQNL